MGQPVPTPLLGQLRLMARLVPHPHLSVFLGPTLNALWTHSEPTTDQPRPGYGPDDRGTLWPGFTAGAGF